MTYHCWGWLDHLAPVVFTKVLPYIKLFFSFSLSMLYSFEVFWKEVTMCNPQLRSRELFMLHVHKGNTFAEIIWNSFAKEICLLLFIHSSFSLWSHRYLIYISACDPIQHYSFYSLNFSSFQYWVLFHLAAMYFLHVPVTVYFFWALLYFLAL